MGKAKDDFRRAAGSGTDKRRSGSEKRRRGKPRSIRFTPEEDRRIVEMEQSTGLAFAALVRHALFNTPPPRGSRRPSVDQQAVAKVLAELGKIGGNVNQLAKQANMGNYRKDSVDMVMRDPSELRLACLQAIGFEREHDDPEPV
jgi:hypothetical protein